MDASILGIHHVTAIAGDAQRNLDFYTQILGLRLVKLTVNFDDPTTYHFYFGDAQGRPGTILTFFPWGNIPRGRAGTGQTSAVSFAVPQDALGFWAERLQQHQIKAVQGASLTGEETLVFEDPDGMRVELVASSGGEAGETWAGAPVAPEQAIRGVHGITLSEEGYESTAALLTETMGFRLAAEQGNRFRYEVGAGETGTYVDLLCLPDAAPGRMGAGAIHHVAFRTPDDAQQQAWRQELARLHYNVSPIMDRQYFHSIYFREPGGVLFEIATDPPGFATDEAREQLGTSLRLPPQYEPHRAEIERAVPPLRLPTAG
jgi:catechol 2,3-dioxygenase-like lactoylglutathione lyase family enzyme